MKPVAHIPRKPPEIGIPVTPAWAATVLREAERADAAELELWAVVERKARAGQLDQVAEIAARRRKAAAVDVLEGMGDASA